MYNYNRYITPQFSSNRNDSYYKPSSTMSYQSLAFKPTLYEQMTLKKDKFYVEDDFQQKPTLRSYRDQYQGVVVQNNKNLQFEFDQLRNKLSNLMLSRMDEQEQFTQLFQEIEEMLQQVEKLKEKIDYFPLIFKDTISSNEFLNILHTHECTQIRLCDIELFFKQINQDQSNFIRKLKLKILLGQNEEKEQQNNDTTLMIIFRIITISIQITSLLEQKRQNFNKLGIRLNEIFDWLDLDKDNYWSEIDFQKRFPNIKLCFKYLTQNIGRSFDRGTFLDYFRQQSLAKYI
ncbi:hypothetical protein pb186bvf_008945 [Paramecium bursaria]